MTVPIPITNARSFLEAMEHADSSKLVFMLNGHPLVAPGYHVTEVKALSYHTMDCGGKADQWRETLVQLWNPEEQEEDEFMSARKFLNIYRRVASHIPVDEDAEIRFEYGNLHRPAVNYHVSGLEEQQDKLLVHLRNPTVTCNARDRSIQAEGTCFSPTTSPAELSDAVPELTLAARPQRATRGCC
jgi:hypothetical protein